MKRIIFGLIVILTMSVCAIFASQITRYDPLAMNLSPEAMLQAPSQEHFFG
ncbi:MAG: ABC transporter permease, partial [Candidatus Omnitrophica bacterium]|nr:ABC transporter permease [Candidatus Omnitrophota bacterium]